MPKQPGKNREWEKERRNRLNEAFALLSKVLPCYDPAISSSKIDILKNATGHIEQLQSKIKELTAGNDVQAKDTVKGEELKKLQERVKRLLSKNEQLCTLLRQAKISIPSGCITTKKYHRPLQWSNRILPDQVKSLRKKETDKENKKVQPRKFTNKSKAIAQIGTPKHRKAILTRTDPKKLKAVKTKIKLGPPSKYVIVLSQPSITTPPCYVITNATSNILGNTSTVITNSGLLTTPLVSSKPAKPVSSIPPLGPGTLILANGTVMPVLPQQTVLPVVRPPLILVPKTSSNVTTAAQTPKPPTTSGAKSLVQIKPKYCLTKTTQINKVPIPALTSRYSNTDLVLKKPDPKPVKTKKVAKEVDKPSETAEKRKPDLVKAEESEAKKAKVTEEAVTEKPPEKDDERPPEPEPQVPEPEKVSEKIPEEDKPEEAKRPEEEVDLNINHSELSNDIFASLQVPAGCQNPESTSPTAAFLLAFPLVSSLTGVKVAEVNEDDNIESQRGTPNLLQIGTMDTTKPTQSESLTPSLLNLDNLSFFSSKEMSNFYSSFEGAAASSAATTTSETKIDKSEKVEPKQQGSKPQPQNLLTECQLPSFGNSLGYQSKSSSKQQNGVGYSVQTSFCNDFNGVAKTTTCCYPNPVRSYPDPLYTNSNTSYNYGYTSESNLNQNYYKSVSKNDNRSYYSLSYDNYTNFSSTVTSASSATHYYSNSQVKSKTSAVEGVSKAPINWMTTPDNRLAATADYTLPQLTKESDFSSIYATTTFTNSQPSYFNNNTVYPNDMGGNHSKSSLDLPAVPPVNSYQRTETEDNQFAWSPTKIPQFLDPSHSFVTTTLPTLVGDLALGNPLTFTEPKCQKRDSVTNRRTKGYESGNFLSVSQLVDHAKEPVPARTTTRRNSGNRSSTKNKITPKCTPRKDLPPQPQSTPNKPNLAKQLSYPPTGDIFCDATAKPRTKNSYSAEALIGPQMQNRQQNYTGGNKFLHDNIIPYFPSVDLSSQENTYIQQNQNYNFPTTSAYNFMHDVTTPAHDLTDALNLFPSSKSCANKPSRNAQCLTPKKSSSKRKHSNEMPGFVDFSFLPMPGSINSPILPDDFHTHTGFLQPPTPQLYPCKNPFTKPNDLAGGGLLPLPPVGASRGEISPSVNNAGTSFANFNLCTIIPEINKTAPEAYLEPPRIKEHGRSYGSGVQVSFNEKPTFNFSYSNTTAQTYNNQ